MLRAGVAFNVRMNDAETAIANVVAQFQKLDASAKGVAAKAVAKIVEMELQTSATLDGLVQGFLATLAASQSAGLTIEQNIELVGKFANALANANIPAEQLTQELRSIMRGSIGPDSQLAKTLQITNADVEGAKQAGTLFDLLNEKVGKLGEAGDTFSTRWSTLQSAIDQSLAKISEPVFDAIFDSLKSLTEELNKSEVSEELRAMGVEVGNLVKAGAGLLQWCLRNAEALSTLAHGAVTVGAAFTGLKLAQLAAHLGLATAAWFTSSKAIDVKTAALARNTAAQVANKIARGATGGAAGAGTARAAGAGAAGGVAARGGLAALAAPFSIVVGGLVGAAMIGSWIDGVMQAAQSETKKKISTDNTKAVELQSRALNVTSATWPQLEA